MKPDLTPHTQLTDEIRAKILTYNEGLTGTLHYRAGRIMKRFSFSRITIEKVIRHTVAISKAKRDITDEERQKILDLYYASEEANTTRKINSVCEVMKRSPDLVRKIVRSNGVSKAGEKLFNYSNGHFQ